MSAPSSMLCAACGQPIPQDAPAGQCPSCLLAIAGRAEEEMGDDFDVGFAGGERRFGNYVLGRQIGAGGMGVVYEARQESQNRIVALKVLRESHGASPVLLCRFTIETEAAARLDHPNIVRVHEVGECNGHPYFSMDLVAGESLGTKIAHGAFPFDWKNAADSEPKTRRRFEAIARLMVKITGAVQHAHERGVLHRDLKPGNILVDQEGEPHLTDFGLAKILQPELDAERYRNLTTQANLPGTPNYMSPEQVSGREATRASDIYGLGAVLYELLSGRPPFKGATTIEIFNDILTHPPARPRRLNPAIPQALETICLKCLEKDPRHRFSSAEALGQDLTNWLEGRPIQARPVSPMRRVTRWSRRNPVGTALILSLCLGLSVSLGLLKRVNDQRQEIETDRDETFDESMGKISLLWEEPDRKDVTISARELAILAGARVGTVAKPSWTLCFGVSSGGSPSSMAEGCALWLNQFQQELGRELGQKVCFSLKLLKRFNKDELSLAGGDADLLLLSPVGYLKARELAPGVMSIAREVDIRDGVIFAHTNAGAQKLSQLAGKKMACPDPDLSLSAWAKARLAGAGLRASDFGAWTNIMDEGLETRHAVISLQETVFVVLQGTAQAGATHRDVFERYKHEGLLMLDRFPETPKVLAARQGLDPRVVAAMRRVVPMLKGRAGLDGHSSDLPGTMVLVDDTWFEPLRRALREAEKFEGGTSR